MNTHSNQELPFQWIPESANKTNAPNGLSAFKKMLTVSSIVLMAALIQFGNEHINGKTTVAATLQDDYLASPFSRTDNPWGIHSIKLLPIDLSEENNRIEFLAAPYISGEDKEAILAGFKQGIQSVGVIYIHDNLSQDGDIIQIESGGLTMDIRLSNEPSLIFLPFASGESLIFRGLYDSDNDGEIAAALETPSGIVSLPILAMGETIELPVR